MTQQRQTRPQPELHPLEKYTNSFGRVKYHHPKCWVDGGGCGRHGVKGFSCRKCATSDPMMRNQVMLSILENTVTRDAMNHHRRAL